MRIGSIPWSVLLLALASGAGCGADALFVNAQLGLDESCEVRADDEHVIERPVFDLARGATGASDACDDPFVALLWVDNPNDERVRLTGAEVALETTARQRLVFDDEEPWPNPFRISTAGALPADGAEVIELEVIPLVFAPSLANFVDDRVEAVIRLFGKTSSGDDVESDVARLPIEICDGCQTLCATHPRAEEVSCSDAELGPLRTFCIDPGC